MQNYECKKCKLIYKKKWLFPKYIEKIYKYYQPTHPGGLNTLKKNFGEKKFNELIKNYRYFYKKKKYDFSDRYKREIIKIINSTNNKQIRFIKLSEQFLKRLKNNDDEYIKDNYLKLSSLIDKPKIYSQFSGFRGPEISNYLKKNIDLEYLKSYGEVGCPLWGNFHYFDKSWIKQFFIKVNEKNFWKTDYRMTENCIKYLSKKIKIISIKKLKNIDFVGLYNFLDHVENPTKLFNDYLKDVRFFGIICEDFNLSKKIDCQHFSSWRHESILYLSNKIRYKIINQPLRLGNSIFKLYILEKKIN